MRKKRLIPSTVLSDPGHRYSLAAKRLRDCVTILDVGGYKDRRKLLKPFLKKLNYKSVNVSSAWYRNAQAHCLYDGKKLPFDDKSFEGVISVDALEHVSRRLRLSLIKEMLRVAEKKVVIIFPFSSRTKSSFENDFAELSSDCGICLKTSIKEHIKFGLPSLVDMRRYLRGHKLKIEFGTNLDIFSRMMFLQLLTNAHLEEGSRRINRKIQQELEKALIKENKPLTKSRAYRAIVTVWT